MEIKKFSREVAGILPQIHVEMLKQQPPALMKSGITFSQMVILGILGGKRDSRMGDLSKTLGVTKSAATGIVDRLLKAGLIRRSRSKADRRVVRIALTSKGRSLSKKIDNFKLNAICGLFSNISQKERMQYLVILRKLGKNIQSKLEYKFYG
ncbi:MAG: MarR family transcriptional regulator [Omnitrophica bacterium]|nr:MarR family transcriptional regulator [Candidatus Omnitrophota bacterium]